MRCPDENCYVSTIDGLILLQRRDIDGKIAYQYICRLCGREFIVFNKED